MKGLVLSGGGAKGAFELGVLHYLYDKNLLHEYKIITGVSVGALNATMVAQGDFPLLLKLWKEIKSNKDIYKGKPLWRIIRGKDSIYDFSPLAKKIDSYISYSRLRNKYAQGYRLGVGFVSLNTGAYIVGDVTHTRFKNMVYASACMPFFAEPVNIKLGQCVDGGLVNMTPLKCAIKWGADDILIVLASPLKLKLGKQNYKGVKNILARTFDIILNELFKNDISVCRETNVLQLKKQIKITIIEPDAHYGETLNFNPDLLNFMYAKGYAKAQTVLG